MTTAQTAEAAVPQPVQGGSYVLDPQTLQLTRVAHSQPAQSSLAHPVDPAVPAPQPAP